MHATPAEAAVDKALKHWTATKDGSQSASQQETATGPERQGEVVGVEAWATRIAAGLGCNMRN